MSDLDKKPGDADGFDVVDQKKVAGGYANAPTPKHDVVIYWEEDGVPAPAPVAPKSKAGKPQVTKKPGRGKK